MYTLLDLIFAPLQDPFEEYVNGTWDEPQNDEAELAYNMQVKRGLIKRINPDDLPAPTTFKRPQKVAKGFSDSL